jgi:RNA polymerase sigma factor (sigma-70 family)
MSLLDSDDKKLIDQAVSGSKKALEDFVKRHQDWIFNIALSFTADHDDAADITQEVLIKVITKLSSFKGDSDVKTWMYRITKNHFLNMKRRKYEVSSLTFEQFGQSLDRIQDESIPGHVYEVEEKFLVEEAKLSCMKAMLLCLDRDQRMIYILGELFEVTDVIGSEIMKISKENFRIKLHRAKQQLYNFMDNKCGLINKNNPCRCAKKTAGFIKMGFVDPQKLYFQRDAITSVDKAVERKVNMYSNTILSEYRQLFLKHPFLKSPDNLESIRKLLASKSIRETFNFD